MKTYTYQECAENFEIWAEYVDPDGTMTREEFDEMTTENKIQICVDCFGKEKIKVNYQDDSDGRGWNVWCGEARGWQPIIGCEDREDVPSIEEACAADPITKLDPEQYEGVEIIE